MKLATSILAFAFLCVSCAHMQDKFLQVRPGMSAAEVTQLLGQPDDRSFANGEEQWTYQSMNYVTSEFTVKLITMKDGKVTSLGNDAVAEQRLHEVEVAKAGATRVNINNGSAGGFGYPLACSHTNAFGRYPPGGGCNAFGCWPAGGQCNAFGCSAGSLCRAGSCPQRITSLRCR